MTSLFPPRESLISDIPTGDRNIEKLFFTVYTHLVFYQMEMYNVQYMTTLF
jgi:hypothetical protein